MLGGAGRISEPSTVSPSSPFPTISTKDSPRDFPLESLFLETTKTPAAPQFQQPRSTGCYPEICQQKSYNPWIASFFPSVVPMDPVRLAPRATFFWMVCR